MTHSSVARPKESALTPVVAVVGSTVAVVAVGWVLLNAAWWVGEQPGWHALCAWASTLVK